MIRRLPVIAALLLAAGLGATAPAQAWEGRGWGPRWSVGINLGLPLYPAPYYYPGYYPAPAVVYAPAPTVVAVPAAAPPSQVVYQYYCRSTNAYYPAVPTCDQPWMKVLPDGTTAN